MTGVDQLRFWEPRLRCAEFVYFIQAEDDSGPVKIGRAKNPLSRIRQLQTGCPWPLKLRYVVPAGTSVERALHRRFDAMRTMGEWFDGEELQLLLLFADALSHRVIETYDDSGALPEMPPPDDHTRPEEAFIEARQIIGRMWRNYHDESSIVAVLNGRDGCGKPLGGRPWTRWDVWDQMDVMPGRELARVKLARIGTGYKRGYRLSRNTKPV